MHRPNIPVNSKNQVRKISASLLLMLLALLTAPRGLAYQPILTFPELALTDGRRYVAVEIINYTANGVVVRHAAGLTVFPYEFLPEAVIAALHLKRRRASTLRTALPYDRNLADKPAAAASKAISVADQPAVVEDAIADQLAVTDAAIADRPAIHEGDASALADKPAVDATEAARSHAAGLVAARSAPDEKPRVREVELSLAGARIPAAYLNHAKAKSEVPAGNLRNTAGAALPEDRASLSPAALMANSDYTAGPY